MDGGALPGSPQDNCRSHVSGIFKVSDTTKDLLERGKRKRGGGKRTKGDGSELQRSRDNLYLSPGNQPI